MFSRNEKIAILEQTTLPRIVLFLKNKGKASRIDLKMGIQASQSAIYSALEILSREQLIEELPPTKGLNRIDVALTEKGKKFAEGIEALEKLL
jgi:DNA-binding MarR family transcriptional regulator